MQHHKQKKKPYVAPKCEVYRIGKCSLMETSAILDGFTVDDLPQGRSEACWLSAHIKRIKKDNHYPRGDEAMTRMVGEKETFDMRSCPSCGF